ncbi:UNVERIFIED_CONTAM: hypothetical protein K0B97_00040 [Spiribacter pallidus]|jgi:hypothetical protein
MKPIIVFGHQRSGHHAFCEFICQNVGGDWVYLNQPKWQNGMIGASTIISSKDLRLGSRVGLDTLQAFEHVVVSFERKQINAEEAREFSELIGCEALCLSFMRDPLNAAASLIKMLRYDRNLVTKLQRQKDVWKSQYINFIEDAPFCKTFHFADFATSDKK